MMVPGWEIKDDSLSNKKVSLLSFARNWVTSLEYWCSLAVLVPD